MHASESKQPLGMEIALDTEDVHAAHHAAIAHGAIELSAPTQKPWGQVVSYVRAPDGTLVECACLCTGDAGAVAWTKIRPLYIGKFQKGRCPFYWRRVSICRSGST